MGDQKLPALPWEPVFRLPDKGVLNYVKDVLTALGVEDIDELEKIHPHWLPGGIMGTLEWVFICGWWIWDNTGFFRSDEAYKFIVEFNGYEFDPDHLKIFRENRERNLFEERFTEPGLTGMERSEGLNWVRNEVYARWAREEGVDPKEFTPPPEFIEMVMWATFMWILSEYGRDWVYMEDEVLACVIDFGVAYMELWSHEKTLLDPQGVKVTNRPINTCRYCGHRLWCVAGAFIGGNLWQNVCLNCYNELWENGVEVDEKDERLRHPKCPHKEGIAGSTRSCIATCPHSGMTQQKVMERMQEAGTERLERYREALNIAGGDRRRLGGHSTQEIVSYFNEEEDR